MPVPAARARTLRLIRLARARWRRRWSRLIWPLWRAHAGIWLAASALVGFEALEVLLGGMILMPELVPLLLVGLAAAWLVRSGSQRAVRVARLQARLIRRRLRRCGISPGRRR